MRLSFGYFGGGLTQSKRILSEKNGFFFGFFSSRRGGRGSSPIQNFLNRKNLGIQIDRGGGLARSEKLKKLYFFYNGFLQTIKHVNGALKPIFSYFGSFVVKSIVSRP